MFFFSNFLCSNIKRASSSSNSFSKQELTEKTRVRHSDALKRHKHSLGSWFVSDAKLFIAPQHARRKGPFNSPINFFGFPPFRLFFCLPFLTLLDHSFQRTPVARSRQHIHPAARSERSSFFPRPGINEIFALMGWVVSHRRFGTTYRSHLFEDGTDRMSRNCGHCQSRLRKVPEERRSQLFFRFRKLPAIISLHLKGRTQ
jgi:hypothetical protein